jgi:hypothetical protein
MGYWGWQVRKLSIYTDTNKTNSEVYDIGASTEVHGLLKVSAVGGTSPSLTVKAQHSIDGDFFEDLAGLAFSAATDASAQTESASTPAYRYIRFQYALTGTTPQVSFELWCFVKTRDGERGGAPPTLVR